VDAASPDRRLTPTTGSAEFLDEERLGGSFRFHTPVGCVADAPASRLTRLTAAGEVVWFERLPWSEGLVVRDGDMAASIGATERPSIFALDVERGVPAWQRFVDGIDGRGLAAVDGVVVIQASVPGAGETLRGYDTRSGAELWRRAVGGRGSLTIVAGGLIHADPTGVSSIDPGTGGARWHRSFGEVDAESIARRHGADGRVDASTDGLFVRVFPATVHRLDPRTGDIIWSWTADDDRIFVSFHAEVAGHLAFATTALAEAAGDAPPGAGPTESIGALDGETGELLWSRPGAARARFEGSEWSVSPESGDTASAGVPDRGGRFDAITGAAAPDRFADDARALVREAAEGHLIVTAHDENLSPVEEWVIDATTGAEVWRPADPVERIDLVQPVHDLLIVTGHRPHSTGAPTAPEGILWALDADTQELRFEFASPDRMRRPVFALEDGGLLVFSHEPELLCD
jgi:outer membrane protein assembly factor BamB